jgi:alkylhydroperoxidase family enzyme
MSHDQTPASRSENAAAHPPPAWIETIDVGEASGKLAETYDRLGARDSIAHIVGVHSLHPAAMEGHVQLYRAIMFGASPLTRVERESIAVVVSAINDCFY